MTDLSKRILLGVVTGVVFAPSLLLADGETPGAATHTVEITGFKFLPATLSVRTGDKIIWINRDIAPHTATAIDETWDTGSLEKDESITTVVGELMTERYFCRFHPHMKAELKLIEARDR